MRKIQISAMAALLAFGLAGCSKEGGQTPDTQSPDGQGAYVSVRVSTPRGGPGTRASSELNAEGYEDDIKSLYLITFNNAGTLVGIPTSETGSGTKSYIEFAAGLNPANDVPAPDVNGVTSPSAQLVSSDATRLVVIANPGPALKAKITALGTGSTFAQLNAAIADINTADIVGDATVGFAMISTPAHDDEDAVVNDVISYPYVDISEAIVLITEDKDGETAREEAEENRVPVKIERLASKLQFNVNESAIEALLTENGGKPDGSTFEFESWTLDVVNETYFPFAAKTLRDSHDGTYYADRNFYTQDPNYLASAILPLPIGHHPNLEYGTVTQADPSWWSPVLPWTTDEDEDGYYGWRGVTAPDPSGDDVVADNTLYVTENTMEGGETATTHGNATRLVIKATYYPKGISSGDWFMYGTNVYDPDRVYANFAALKAAYDADVVDAAANPTLTYPLIAAYEKFAGQIKAYYDSEAPVASDAPAAPATIADVTAEHLDGIENVGGEVAKVGIDGVGIHWYQNGLNYYASVVRHDNTVTVDNGYTKYGVVRNNWYLLTLTRVSGPGTPWYPDPNKPGEGDPDPTTPVDKSKGYLGITVTPAPWVKWDTNIGI